MHFVSIRVLLKRIKAIRFMMVDRNVKWTKKLLIVACIVYLFLPIDIIPPFLLPFGFIDDIIIWLLVLWYLSHDLDKYWTGGKSVDLGKKFRKKGVVDAEFTVEDEQTTEGENEDGNK